MAPLFLALALNLLVFEVAVTFTKSLIAYGIDDGDWETEGVDVEVHERSLDKVRFGFRACCSRLRRRLMAHGAWLIQQDMGWVMGLRFVIYDLPL